MAAVLVIGLDPGVIDFSAAPFKDMPGISAASIRAGLKADEDKLRGLGFDAETLLVDDGATAERVVADKLAATPRDIVVIGAGIRTLPQYFDLFEKLLNLIHRDAPGAAIAFNTSPQDTAEAAQRWA